MRKSFTLIELIVVLIVVGILATIGIPTYRKAVLGAEGRGAVANLKAIQTSEKVIDLERGVFVACANLVACNTALNLDMPPDDNYTYGVTIIGGAGGFRARADHVDSNCQYDTTFTQEPEVSAGTCIYEP